MTFIDILLTFAWNYVDGPPSERFVASFFDAMDQLEAKGEPWIAI